MRNFKIRLYPIFETVIVGPADYPGNYYPEGRKPDMPLYTSHSFEDLGAKKNRTARGGSSSSGLGNQATIHRGGGGGGGGVVAL